MKPCLRSFCRLRQEAIRQAERERRDKYKKQEEEREGVRQSIRDKVKMIFLNALKLRRMFYTCKTYEILVQEVPKQLYKTLHISKFSKFTLDKHKIQSTIDFQLNSSLVLLLSTYFIKYVLWVHNQMQIRWKCLFHQPFTNTFRSIRALSHVLGVFHVLHQIHIQSYNIITHFLQ